MEIDRILQTVIGDRRSFRQSATVGTVSSLLMAVFFILYFVFVQTREKITELPFFVESNFGFWFVIVYISLAFLVTGGYSIGWLVIRPTASIVRALIPELETRRIWTFSTIIAWTFISLTSLFPYAQTGFITQIFVALVIVVWVTATGIVSGKLAERVTAQKTQNDTQIYAATGGVVTGSLLMVYQTVVKLFDNPEFLPRYVIGFFISVSIISLIAAIPNAFIVLIATGVSKLNIFSERTHLVFVLVSGFAWTAIGYLFFITIFPSETISLKSYSDVFVLGILGACGGWAIGEFRKEETESPASSE